VTVFWISFAIFRAISFGLNEEEIIDEMVLRRVT
jgi:hypothetical protein